MQKSFTEVEGWNVERWEYWAHRSIIPLFHYSAIGGLVMAMLFFSVRSFSAEAVKFRHVQSVYLDERERSLKEPEGVACDAKSNVVVGDTGNDRLVRYSFQGKSLKGGNEIKIPQLSNPIRVQINSKGEIFALDGKKRRILRLSPEGAFKGYVDAEGGPSPSTSVPRSFKIDTDNNIYILDIFSGRVLILTPEGKYQRQIQFPKEYGFFSDLALDSRGSVLLVDCIKATVFSAAKNANSFSPSATGLREYLNFPTGITTDRKGTIYIVDENGCGIVMLNQDGSFLGRQLSMGWNEGMLYYPSQISVNEKGEVFVADRGNSRVQIFAIIQ